MQPPSPQAEGRARGEDPNIHAKEPGAARLVAMTATGWNITISICFSPQRSQAEGRAGGEGPNIYICEGASGCTTRGFESGRLEHHHFLPFFSPQRSQSQVRARRARLGPKT